MSVLSPFVLFDHSDREGRGLKNSGRITVDISPQLTQILKELFSSQRLATLATQGEGQAYGSLVAFAATSDLKYLLFATTRATRKYANLTEAPRIAMVIDNRTNQESDFHQTIAATADRDGKGGGGKRKRILPETLSFQTPLSEGFRDLPHLCTSPPGSGDLLCCEPVSECDGASYQTMSLVLSLHGVRDEDRGQVGEKAFSPLAV